MHRLFRFEGYIAAGEAQEFSHNSGVACYQKKRSSTGTATGHRRAYANECEYTAIINGVE